MARAWRRGLVRHDFDAPMPDMPARPAEPELLPPNQMPKRGRGGSERGRIALLPALAHVEFLAIDRAFDLAGRFRPRLPPRFVEYMVGVGSPEAVQFRSPHPG